MFQQFLDSVQEKHLQDIFLFQNEVSLVSPILKDEAFRTACKTWLEKAQKVRNEGPVFNGLDSQKLQRNILVKIRKSKNLLEKYHLCNRSLIHLHPKTKDFEEIRSQIYYERANVLIKTENYHEALQSLLMMTQTDEIKVVYRKALCALKSNNGDLFKEGLSELRLLYANVESKPDNIRQELEKYGQEYKKLLTKDVAELPATDSVPTKEFLEKYKDISLKITPEKGRHIIADESIDDTYKILKEKAFAFVPLRPCFTSSDKSLNTYDCQHCAKTNIIPVLCKTCNHAIYCSFDCILRHQKIHLYECRGHQLWLWHDIGIAYLAFRTFLEGFSQFKGLLEENFAGKDLTGILETAVEVEFSPERDQYRLLLSLQTHFEEMMQGDLVTFALTACALTLYLKTETTFFSDGDLLEDPVKWEVLASSMILRHIGQMVCNAHTMSDTRVEYDGESFPPFKNNSLLGLKRTGLVIRSDETFAAIYPFISLLNHSCKPNISNRFNGTQLIITAKGTINESDEIFNSYGINYLRQSKEERQAALRSQYYFDCECDPCLQPEDSFLSLQKLRCYTCQNLLEANFDELQFDMKCGKCGTSFDMEQFNWMMRKVSDNVEEIRDENTLKTVLRALNYCTQCLHPYHEVIYFFSKTLVNSVGDFDPNFRSELRVIAENMLNICTYLYGKNSVEHLLDRVCAVRVLPKHEEEIFQLAENVLSDQSLDIFKHVYPVIVAK